MAEAILGIGCLLFFSHFLSFQFKKTHIPDVLVLMFVGVILGPVLHIVSPEDFGKVGSLLATIALVVILFESGTSLNLETLNKALKITSVLTLGGFALTVLLISSLGYFFLHLGWLPAAMLGVILGGTSAAVVIPMVNALKLSEKPSTVLVLESALTDVLSIIVMFALLQVHTQSDVDVGRLLGSVLSSIVFAALIGIVGGIGWLLVLEKIRGFPNTISSTLAYVFIVYGVAEFLGFSGAIASLALGVSLTNYMHFNLHHFKMIGRTLEPLNHVDVVFYQEAVFLLKTFFFIYLGISVYFSNTIIAQVSLLMVVLVFLMRIFLMKKVFASPVFSLRDTAFASMLAPKGLAAAVLATLPLQYGVIGGEEIRDTTYMVVLFSISISALLVILYQYKKTQNVYAVLLKKK